VNKLAQWAWSAAVFFLVGCVSPPPTVELNFSLSAREVSELLAQPVREVQSLKALGTLGVERQDGKLVLDANVLMIAGQGVRIDVISPFFTPIISMSADANELTILDYVRHQARIGPATADSANAFYQLRVEPSLLAQIVAGGLVLPQQSWNPVPPAGEDEQGLWIYASDPWRVGLDPHSKRPVYLARQENELLIIAWSRIQPENAVDIAHEINLTRPGTGQALHLKLKEVELNKPLAKEALQLEIPPGWTVLRLGTDVN